MSTLSVRADAGANPEHDDATAPAGFWQRPIVQDVLPFFTSLVFHLAILAVGFLTYQAAINLSRPVSIAPPVMPDGINSDEFEMSLRPHLNPSEFQRDEKFKTIQDFDPSADLDSKGLSNKTSELLTMAQAG